MNFSDYIIKYNSQSRLDEAKMIDLSDVDLTEDGFAGKLMGFYIDMLKEKIERKKILRSEETFELSGMNENEKYMFDSLAGVYIYENQFHRKHIQEEIAERVSLSMAKVKEIAMANIGEIQEATLEEKSKMAKLVIDENEPNA